jgi:hypothetical protein
MEKQLTGNDPEVGCENPHGHGLEGTRKERESSRTIMDEKEAAGGISDQ